MSCNLYRHFDKNGVLLYVGISINPFKRLLQHRQTATWLADVASLTIEKFSSIQEALSAERRAIELEKPLHNKAHNRAARAVAEPQHSVQVNRCQPSIGVNPEQLAGMTNDDLKRELLHAISAADQCAFDAVQKEIAKRIVAAVTKAA